MTKKFHRCRASTALAWSRNSFGSAKSEFRNCLFQHALRKVEGDNVSVELWLSQQCKRQPACAGCEIQNKRFGNIFQYSQERLCQHVVIAQLTLALAFIVLLRPAII